MLSSITCVSRRPIPFSGQPVKGLQAMVGLPNFGRYAKMRADIIADQKQAGPRGCGNIYFWNTKKFCAAEIFVDGARAHLLCLLRFRQSLNLKKNLDITYSYYCKLNFLFKIISDKRVTLLIFLGHRLRGVMTIFCPKLAMYEYLYFKG